MAWGRRRFRIPVWSDFKAYMFLRSNKTPSPIYRNFIAMIAMAGFVFAAEAYIGNESVWRSLVMPLMHSLDAERAHKISITLASYGIVPRIAAESREIESYLNTRTMGISFRNPVGLAAGFDKNAVCFPNLATFGFGFVEVGTVTPRLQKGNPKPRMFRLLEHNAFINRMGFNNFGIELVRKNIEKRIDQVANGSFKLGVNIGINKNTDNPYNDYKLGVNYFKDCCHFIVINVSSPNTPGLRTLQQREYLEKILKIARAELEIGDTNLLDRPTKPKLLVKIAPDLTLGELDEIIQLFKENPKLIDGIIISNTSIKRFGLPKNEITEEQGGLSGAPLKDVSTNLIGYFYQKTQGNIPIIGSGGIFTGADAFEKIANGASLIEVYTAMAIEGPLVVGKIKQELVEILKEKDFTNISQAVGCNFVRSATISNQKVAMC